jgi:hypothetical protein
MSRHNATHLADLEILPSIRATKPPVLEVDSLFPSKFKNSFAGTLSWQYIASFGF